MKRNTGNEQESTTGKIQYSRIANAKETIIYSSLTISLKLLSGVNIGKEENLNEKKKNMGKNK
jgi:hypothetical protein